MVVEVVRANSMTEGYAAIQLIYGQLNPEIRSDRRVLRIVRTVIRTDLPRYRSSPGRRTLV